MQKSISNAARATKNRLSAIFSSSDKPSTNGTAQVNGKRNSRSPVPTAAVAADSSSATSGATPVLRPKLSELAAQISANAKIVEDYIESQGLPYPSFAIDGPTKFPLPFPDTPELEKVHDARNGLLAASKRIYDLTTGPHEVLQWLIWNMIDSSALQVIVRFDLANVVPTEGDISFADIGKQINVPEVKVRQVLRTAMTNNIFCEPRHGYVAHTAASKILKDDEAMLYWVEYNANDLSKGFIGVSDALEKFPDSYETAECAFGVAHGLGPYQYFGKYPEKGRRFGLSMKSFSEGQGFNENYLLKGYDWSKLPKDTTFVDIGGATGHISVAIAKQNPGFKFVVQDHAKTALEHGEAVLDPELKPRFQFLDHDFFNEQPTIGADVYFIRWCLHNCADKYALLVIKNLVPALKNGSKVIINEIALPQANTMNQWAERRVRLMDMTMLVSLNATEREIGDWKRIFAEADPRFRFDSVNQPNGSLHSIVEFTFVDE